MTIVQIGRNCPYSLLDELDIQFFTWFQKCGVGTYAIAFDMSGFDFVGDGMLGDVDKRENSGGLLAKGD